MTAREPKVVWSPEATEDVDRLWEYYAEHSGRTTADKVVSEVIETAATIGDFPFAGRSRDELINGLRSIAAGTQILFYRVAEDQPQIVRVLDGRRDIERIFSKIKPTS